MDRLTLSSGRVLEPNRGFIGINPKLQVCEGYDCDWNIYPLEEGEVLQSGAWDKAVEDDTPFTLQERREIADYVIALWRRWADGEGPHD